jgi:hypothetical protein
MNNRKPNGWRWLAAILRNFVENPFEGGLCWGKL